MKHDISIYAKNKKNIDISEVFNVQIGETKVHP